MTLSILRCVQQHLSKYLNISYKLNISDILPADKFTRIDILTEMMNYGFPHR